MTLTDRLLSRAVATAGRAFLTLLAIGAVVRWWRYPTKGPRCYRR